MPFVFPKIFLPEKWGKKRGRKWAKSNKIPSYQLIINIIYLINYTFIITFAYRG